MSAPTNAIRQNLCKHLRSNEMYYSDKPHEVDAFHGNLFWCDLTQDGMGPDGTCAHMEECSRLRDCFEE